MIKFVIHAENTKDRTHKIGLGLSEANLSRIMDKNQPVSVPESELRLPEPIDTDFLIMGGVSQKLMLRRMQPLIDQVDESKLMTGIEITRGDTGQVEKYERQPGHIPMQHLAGKLYVAMLPMNNGRHLHLLGLDHVSCQHLRRRKVLTYRTRLFTSLYQQVRQQHEYGFELFLFWCRHESEIEQQFLLYGIIGPSTTYEKHEYGRTDEQQGEAAYWTWRTEGQGRYRNLTEGQN